MPQPEDTELLRRYADEGAEAAFAELVRRRIDLVYSVALRHVGGDAHLAQDVTQRVFTALARKAATLTSRPSLSAWLYRSAQFAASDVVRAERRRRVREQEAHAMDELERTSRDLAQNVDWEKLAPVLDEVMSGLGEHDRDAVALRFFEQCTFADIGAKLKLTEDAARMRVDRALEKMRALLARRGITSSASALALALADHAALASAPLGLATSISSAAMASGAATSGVLVLLGVTKLKAMLGISAAAFALTAAGAGYFAMVWSHQRDELLESRRTLAAAETAQSNIADLETQLNSLERDRDETSKRLSDARARLALRRATQSPSSPDARMRRQAEMTNRDPRFASFRKVMRRRAVQKEYGETFADLELPPDKLEELKQVLVSEATTRWLVAQEFTDAGMMLSDSDFDEVFAEFHKTVTEPQVRALLGEEKFAIFARGETIAKKITPVVERLKLDLAGAGLPLDSMQTTALARVFYAIPDDAESSRSAPNAASSVLSAAEELRLDRASGILSAEQIKATAAFFVHERNERRLEEKFLEASTTNSVATEPDHS